MNPDPGPPNSGVARVAVLHASAVRAPRGALIFLGPSGTGKSTICELLQGRAAPLANDTVYLLRRSGGGWGVADGGRRALDGPLTEDEARSVQSVPLQAIVRLYQSRRSACERLAPLALCRYLTDALFEVPWQREYGVALKRALFADLAQVARDVPGYAFCFDCSPTGLELLGSTLVLW